MASQSKKEQKTEAKKDEFEFFFGPSPKCTFSQFHTARFTVDGISYNCLEQYLHHQKALTFNDGVRASEIMKTSDPKEQKKFGDQVQNFDKVKWDHKCADAIKQGILAKYQQNPDLKQILFATYPKTLVDASPRDRMWGIGLGKNNPKALSRTTWRGKNLLGDTLTDVRNYLMKEEGLISNAVKTISAQSAKTFDKPPSERTASGFSETKAKAKSLLEGPSNKISKESISKVTVATPKKSKEESKIRETQSKIGMDNRFKDQPQTFKDMTSKSTSDQTGSGCQKEQNTEGKEEEFEFFFGPSPKCTFSQFHPVRFTVDGISYNCLEQYLHHQKALTFNDGVRACEIMKTSDLNEQKKLGEQVQNFDKVKWDQKCADVIKRGILAKYHQNPDLKQTLFATYPKTLVDASPRDRVWGIGLGRSNPNALSRATWRGKNRLGDTLTNVRNYLMKEEGLIPDAESGRNIESKSKETSSSKIKKETKNEELPTRKRKTDSSRNESLLKKSKF